MATPLPDASCDEDPPRAAGMVLVVEDDEDHRSTMASTLANEGYHVETAIHGADALAQLHAGARPDVILLDLLMPEVDGWAFMAVQKREPALASIPVVVFTGGGDRVLSSAPVAAGYLAKPIGRRRLLDTIEHVLRTRGSSPGPPPGRPSSAPSVSPRR